MTETLRVAVAVALPTLAGGVIKRRPAAMAVAGKLQVDRPAVRLLRRLRDRHYGRPLRLRVPGRTVELALSGADVKRVLAGAPTPFSPSTVEKRAALGHFQPHGVLISGPADRPARRAFTEATLQPGRPLHALAEPFARAIAEEAATLRTAETLDWDTFNVTWWRVVRRVVLGSAARDDTTLTGRLERLRLDANWAYLHPKRRQLREEFRQRLAQHLDRAEPGSLAAVIGAEDTAPDQVAHWLFAFDAAGMVTFRTLALLAAHPAEQERAREEIEGPEPAQLSFLRACVLESVRLWPTTPMILRETAPPRTRPWSRSARDRRSARAVTWSCSARARCWRTCCATGRSSRCPARSWPRNAPCRRRWTTSTSSSGRCRGSSRGTGSPVTPER